MYKTLILSATLFAATNAFAADTPKAPWEDACEKGTTLTFIFLEKGGESRNETHCIAADGKAVIKFVCSTWQNCQPPQKESTPVVQYRERLELMNKAFEASVESARKPASAP